MQAPYAPAAAAAMRHLFASLNERDRRLYAATEARKLGRGGLRYLARLLDCDPKTIRRGLRELAEPSPLLPGQARK